jgi:hypothetical protein
MADQAITVDSVVLSKEPSGETADSAEAEELEFMEVMADSAAVVVQGMDGAH